MACNLDSLDLQTLLVPVVAAEDALARLDERVARSDVGPGFIERADFFEAVSNRWVAGELVHLEDLVLHDAQMDIRAPTHELVIAHRILRARRRILRHAPGWAISRAGTMALSSIDGEADPQSRPTHGEGELKLPVQQKMPGKKPKILPEEEGDVLPPELAELDAVLAQTEWLVEGEGALAGKIRQPDLSVGELIIRDPDWDETERITQWLNLAETLSPTLPATLATAILWDAWEGDEPLQRQHWLGQLLVSDYLRLRCKVGSHLLAFSVGLREIRRERRHAPDQTTRLIAFLEAMTAAAGAGTKDLERLTLAKQQLQRRAEGRRSNSSLPTVIDLILSRPIVSAAMVAKAANITQRGALNLIGELGVREITGRGRYRAWGVI